MSTDRSTFAVTASAVSPAGKRRDLVAGLDLGMSVVFRRTVSLSTANDPYVSCWCLDLLDVVGHRACPTWRRDKKVGGLCPGRAPTWRREHVGPHIEHRGADNNVRQCRVRK